MGAFDPIWSDIDETAPGQPYVVDSNGWGWFMIFVLLATPFFLMGIFLLRFAKAVCAHPYISSVVYLSAVLILGIILYARGYKKHRFWGVLAVILSLLPMAYVQSIYLIPYIMLHDGLFGAVFEWILVTAFLVIITFFVTQICYYLGNGLVHLLIALIFLAIVVAIVRPPEEATWSQVQHLYSLAS